MLNLRLDENRIRESDWFDVPFSEEEVAEAKKIRQYKDSNRWGDHFDSDTRWVGHLGEIAFRVWLNQYGFPYKHWDLRDEKDTRDFTFGRLEIDVKTTSTKFPPKMHYGVEVLCSQLDNDVVNSFVFCRYNLETNVASMLGWLPKDEFIDKSIERKAGDKVTESFTVRADMLEVKLRQLKPLIDLDRYR